MQLKVLQKRIDDLHKLHGHSSLKPISGAGCIKNPKVMFVFMNPTGRNVSSCPKWRGLRAPWIGTKNVWRLFYELGILPKHYFQKIQKLKSEEWTTDFATEVYKEIAKKKVYITNLAKCTQVDARPLKDNVFKNYLDVMSEEILLINPKFIFTFGNQVSSILLTEPISVSKYKGRQKEILEIRKKKFSVYPVYYPVGQGQRNLPLAIKRIKGIIKTKK